MNRNYLDLILGTWDRNCCNMENLRCFESEAAIIGLLWDKVFLEISQNSQKNSCARVSFLIKLQASGLQLYIKKATPAQVFSCEFCEFSKNTFFTEHVRTSTSGKCLIFEDYKSSKIFVKVLRRSWKVFSLFVTRMIFKKSLKVCINILKYLWILTLPVLCISESFL